MFQMSQVRLLATLCAFFAGDLSAWAQTDLPFYNGKEIRLMVGYASGGGYDTYARVVAQFLGKHIPGNPTIVVQNMPGADGLALTNHMYTRAPKDGTVIALTNRNLAVAPTLGLIDVQNVHYNPSKLYWLANLNTEVSVMVVRNDVGVGSIDDLPRKQIVVGATGVTSNNAVYPYVMNNLLHTKLKVVTGYPGTSHLTLALERGEIQGIGGWAWSSILIQKPDWVRDKTILLLLQLSPQKHPDLANVPLILDLAKTEDERQALSLIVASETTGRSFFASPDIDPERGSILRAAFAKLVDDPGFKTATDKAKLDVSFMDGDTLEKMVKRLNATSPNSIELAKRLTQRNNTEIKSKPQ
jgi:tripartite-type tricarboxylate transporter receptor subunit TctC